MKLKMIGCFLFLSFSLSAKEYHSASNTTAASPEWIDQTKLALRQVGHELLQAAGNDSLAIQPIQQVDQHIFLLPLAQSFNYDTLPFLLHQALAIFNMEQMPYYVTVKDCQTDTIILGYDIRQFIAQKVPCIGRHQYVNCNHIYLTFPNRKVTIGHNNKYLIFSLLTFILLGITWYYRHKKSKITNNTSISKHGSTLPPTPFLSIGQSQLDITNQQLTIKGIPKELTFREAKLLHYFGSHPNQLLNREQILAQVWGNEGVIVGRSLDVFVSRLRKILKGDTSLEIKTIHGVGYRLEVK